jgi:hypothetical protein
MVTFTYKKYSENVEVEEGEEKSEEYEDRR